MFGVAKKQPLPGRVDGRVGEETSGQGTPDAAHAVDAERARWDGLKGYLTNTDLPPRQIMENYSQLWHVEKAFRISKTDLRIRPMYHRRRQRIEAHVLVAFVAYTIYKELERRLKLAKLQISPQRAAELTQTMYEMTFCLPNDPKPRRTLLQMDDEQQQLWNLFS